SVLALDGDVITLGFPTPDEVQAFKQTGAQPGSTADVLRTAIVDALGLRVRYMARVSAGAPAVDSAAAPASAPQTAPTPQTAPSPQAAARPDGAEPPVSAPPVSPPAAATAPAADLPEPPDPDEPPFDPYDDGDAARGGNPDAPRSAPNEQPRGLTAWSASPAPDLTASASAPAAATP
ncbi:hypothetical protein OOT08_08065, partial [Leucobacter sp. M11]|nr:hypothetical protein [Leucobacter sp. M11]